MQGSRCRLTLVFHAGVAVSEAERVLQVLLKKYPGIFDKSLCKLDVALKPELE